MPTFPACSGRPTRPARAAHPGAGAQPSNCRRQSQDLAGQVNRFSARFGAGLSQAACSQRNACQSKRSRTAVAAVIKMTLAAPGPLA